MATNVSLQTERICCDKTTEAGADEVSIIIAAVCSNQSKSFVRKFGPIDMNDGNQPFNNPSGDSHCINDQFHKVNGSMFSQAVEPGEKWEVAIILIEIDGGTTASEQEILAVVLQHIPTPVTVVAGSVLNILTQIGLFHTDTDDYLGSISFTIRAENDGTIASAFTQIDRISFFNADARHVEVRFNGDGSDYLLESKLIF